MVFTFRPTLRVSSRRGLFRHPPVVIKTVSYLSVQLHMCLETQQANGGLGRGEAGVPIRAVALWDLAACWLLLVRRGISGNVNGKAP